MDLQKVYFKAANEAEARVIIGLLETEYHCEWSDREDAWDARVIWVRDNQQVDGVDDPKDAVYFKDRTEAPASDLFEFAMRGLKEPWEVPPEGYRIVTEEERELYKAPENTMLYHEDCPDVGWNNKFGETFDPPCCDKIVYAVPLDYEFATEQDIEVGGKMYSVSTIKNALRDYVK